MRRRSVLVLATFLLAACQGGSASSEAPRPVRSSEPAASATVAAPRSSEPSVACPNPAGGACLGELDGGTYHTRAFVPELTYRVPDGWSNMEDLPGNVLLLPPGRDLDGVDAGAVDYLGVYSGVEVAAADCRPEPARAADRGPRAIVNTLADRPGLSVTPPRDVEIGGLRGQMIVIELTRGTDAGCEVEGGLTIVPLIIGVGPASVEHAQVPGLVTHLYVLRHGSSNVVIEASDVEHDRRPFPFGAVVNDLELAPR